MKVLVTGGAGYIGSHTCLKLLEKKHSIHVVDNLSNSHLTSLDRVRKLTNTNFDFSNCDIRDFAQLSSIMKGFKPDVVLHFAGLKSVSESVSSPALYYDVNVGGTAVLLQAMDNIGCANIVFSSSATVYGIPQYLPCDEKHPLSPVNPYGKSKLMAETVLQDWCSSQSERTSISLRYFNPVGADPSGEIGEDPIGVPSNLMPFVSQVAIGRKNSVKIFGVDYETVDGTGVRDYIHVVDLAVAHILAIESSDKLHGFEAINIGTGNGISVLQLINEFEKQSQRLIPIEVTDRRPGDVAECWADNKLAFSRLGFKTSMGIKEMCRDTWNWQSSNPLGYLDE